MELCKLFPDRGPGRYSFTNESLPAIVAGLDIQPTDSVLTVGVDQTFTVLEYADRVTAIDIDPYYLEIIRQRKAMLEAENYEKFLTLDIAGREEYVTYQRRNTYFLEQGRLQMIRQKLSRLRIAEPGDVVAYAVENPHFQRMYLSNALGFGKYSHSPAILDALQKLSQSLPSQASIYVAAHYPTWESKLPAGLVLDEDLSKKAKNREQVLFWNPRIYRKI